jgi:transposase InsO family protein
MTYRLTHPLQ